MKKGQRDHERQPVEAVWVQRMRLTCHCPGCRATLGTVSAGGWGYSTFDLVSGIIWKEANRFIWPRFMRSGLTNKLLDRCRAIEGGMSRAEKVNVEYLKLAQADLVKGQRNGAVRFNVYREIDPAYADISYAFRDFGFQPYISFEPKKPPVVRHEFLDVGFPIVVTCQCAENIVINKVRK